MRRLSFPGKCLVGLLVFTIAGPVVARAQDANNPDVLKKELAETLGQLKAAQDRKSELATENEKLKQQLAAIQKEVEETRRAQATWAEQTYALRAHHQAWQAFVSKHPRLRAQWEVFLEMGPIVAQEAMPSWGVSADAPSTTQATLPATTTTTTPGTAPATEPADTAPATSTSGATTSTGGK